MTFDTYILTSFLKSVKLYDGKTSAVHANNHTRLAHEGLEILGYYNWQNTEDIAELKGTYFLISQKLEQLETLREEGEILEQNLSATIEERNEGTTKHNAKMFKLKDTLQELISERESIGAKLNEIKVTINKTSAVHEGLLLEQQKNALPTDGEDKISQCVRRLQDLKLQEETTTTKYRNILTRIQSKTNELSVLKKPDGSDTVQPKASVGDNSRNLSKNKVAQKRLQNELQELYLEVGTYLYANQQNRTVRKATRSHRRLLTQVRALHKSVSYHRRLVH